MTRSPRLARSRRRLRFRPSLQTLEPRNLMAFAGSLDPTFGTQMGYTSLNVPTNPLVGPTTLSLVKVKSDGTILAAGDAGTGAFGVLEVDPSGSLVTSFGTNGQAIVNLPSGFQRNSGITPSLLVQPDGKMLLVMGISALTPTFDVSSMVVRLTAGGALDTSYGTDGVVIIDQSKLNALSYDGSAALQPDGKLVVYGTSHIPGAQFADLEFADQLTVVRINTDGTYDTSFDGDGVVHVRNTTNAQLQQSFPVESASDIVVQGDGKIDLLAKLANGVGYFYPHTPELIRLNTDGTRDASLTAEGLTAAKLDTPRQLILQPDGNFLILGETTFGPSGLPSSMVTRVNALGVLIDSSPVLGISDNIALQLDGKVIVQKMTLVQRLRSDLVPDSTFGQTGGRVVINNQTKNLNDPPSDIALAIGPDNKIVLAGNDFLPTSGPNTINIARLTATGSAHPGDLSGDGIADVAVYLNSLGSFAIRPSEGGADQIVPFGIAGAGNTIPAPGDYDNSGRAEIGAYLPTYGVYAYRPANGGADVLLPFGTPGVGQSIPVPADYYGTGQDDIAVYLAAVGVFAIRDPSGGPGRLEPFGIAGVGNSIPAPGDYDGDGKTDLAVYLPSFGAFAYRPSSGGTDVITAFGIPGAGNSLPMTGDYNGDGKTDLAVYIPSQGFFYYRLRIGLDVSIPFGPTGLGQTLPAPGDYNGDGVTEIAAYFPDSGLFGYRSADGWTNKLQQFGIAGTGQTIPVTVQVPPILFPGPSVSAESIPVPGLPDDGGVPGLLGPSKKKKMA